MRCIFLTRADMPFRAQSSPACLPPTRAKITLLKKRRGRRPARRVVVVVPAGPAPSTPLRLRRRRPPPPPPPILPPHPRARIPRPRPVCLLGRLSGATRRRACARVTVTWAPPSPIPSPSPPRLPLSRDRQAEDGPFYIPLVLESLTPLSIYCGSSPGHCPRTLRHSYSQLLLSSLRSLVSS